MKLSVIIPVAPWDSAWTMLTEDLRGLDDNEILFCGPPQLSKAEGPSFAERTKGLNARWVNAPLGRASQLNSGAKAAGGTYLLFLHADSRLPAKSREHLLDILRSSPDGILYFDLDFLGDGPAATALNAIGANLRSRLLGMPFGDQGFCLRKALFENLGRFPTDKTFGEDHLFVWAARRRGIALTPIGAKLYTSARKYAEKGWLATTAKHLIMTYYQAAPQWLGNMRAKISRLS